MKMHAYIYLIIWICLHLALISTNEIRQSFQIKKEHLNKRLLGYKMFEKNVLGHHACAYECMFLGACKSINFIGNNKTCDFNSKGSETVESSEFVESKRTIFSDITDWPRSIASGCAFHACGPKQRCFPLGDTVHECINITCDEPKHLQYGIVQSGTNTVGSVRSYTCPVGMFLSSNVSITCLLSGEWTEMEYSCKVSTIGSSCNNTEDCNETGAECLVGTCVCGRLYRYDANTKDCVKVCSTMKDTFTVHTYTKISGYNDRGFEKDITVTNCRQNCTDDVDCLSFEYKEDTDDTGRCRWSSVTMEMIDDVFPEFIKSDLKDLYSRDCV